MVFQTYGYFSLHNRVNIKIVIIHKNRKNIQISLLLSWVWCIVFVQYVYSGRSMPDVISRFHETPLPVFGGFMSLGSATLLSKSSNSALQIALVAACWSAGLFLGCFCAYSLPDNSFSMMRMLPGAAVSIVSVPAQILFFVLITPVLFWRKNIVSLYCLAFVKAFCFGLIQAMVDQSFLGVGWLMRPLVSFSGIFFNLALLWFWFRCISLPNAPKKHAFVFCILMLPVIFIDYFSVNPFVTALFHLS